MRRRGIRPTLECFDLSHVDSATLLISEGLVEPPFHYGIVLNVPGGVRYDVGTLDFFVKRIPVGAFWTAIGVGGRGSVQAMLGAVATGGFVRVGFEDNVYYSKGVLAESNAQLVERAASIIRAGGGEVASPDDVRALLKLRG
jgi:3-keto-5-aminohexanoate cleavage enzyme